MKMPGKKHYAKQNWWCLLCETDQLNERCRNCGTTCASMKVYAPNNFMPKEK